MLASQHLDVSAQRAVLTQCASCAQDTDRRTGRGKTRKVEVAEELCVLYHEAVRAEVATLTKGGHRMPSQTLDDVDESDRSCS